MDRIDPLQIDAVEFLHSIGLVHRDIKPENIVVDFNDIARLCDFGMALSDGQTAGMGSGTLPYMAPELLLSRKAQVCLHPISFSKFIFISATHPC